MSLVLESTSTLHQLKLDRLSGLVRELVVLILFL